MAVIIPILIPSGGAAIAAQVAARQKSAECSAWLPSFRHDAATIEQMRYYASCVEWLYPTATGSVHLWFKALILSSFVGLAIGIWVGRKSTLFDTWYGRAVWFGGLGSMIGPAAVFICTAAFHAALYLVT